MASSCSWSGFRDQLGVSAAAPDEFLIDKRESLVIPKELRLPTPGSGKNSISRAQEAEEILFGSSSSKSTQSLSAIEKQVLNASGANTVNNDIRNRIENDFENESSIFGTTKGGTLESIVDPFGYNRTKPTIVDGYKENQRIREAIQNDENINTEEVEIVEDW